MSYQHECPVCGHKRSMPMTNADRIRAMNDEELATQLVQVFKEGIKVLTDKENDYENPNYNHDRK